MCPRRKREGVAGRRSVLISVFIIGIRRGTPSALLEQAVVTEPADGPVQRSGLELQVAVGVLEDVLHDAVPVPFLRGQHQEDQEVDGSEREVVSGIGHMAASGL